MDIYGTFMVHMEVSEGSWGAPLTTKLFTAAAAAAAAHPVTIFPWPS